MIARETSQDFPQAYTHEESQAALGIVEFMRRVCLRLIVSELAQVRYEGEFERAASPAAVPEEKRIARQSEDFLRRQSEEARRNLDAAFELAEEHLASQALKACVGALAKRLARCVSHRLDSIASMLNGIVETAGALRERETLERALEGAKEIGALLEELSGMGDEADSPEQADLGEVLGQSMALWRGEDKGKGKVDSSYPKLTVPCRPSTLKAAFLITLEQLEEQCGGEELEVSCQVADSNVWVIFSNHLPRAHRKMAPFSLDLAQRIVSRAGGRLSLAADPENDKLFCRLVFNTCPRSVA